MTILKNNLKRIFGRKVNILFMLVIPIVVNIFIISASTGEAKWNLGISDKDNTQFTQEFIALMKEDCNIITLTEEDDVSSMILNRKIDCSFIFEDGFTDDLIAGKDVQVKSHILDGTNQTGPIQIRVASYITAAKEIAKVSNNNAIAFYEGMEKYKESKYSAEYKNFDSSYKEDINTAVSSLGYMAFAMLFLITFSTGLLLEDKLSGVFDRIATTPLRASSYYTQHLLSYFIVAAIQVVVVINVLPSVVKVSYGNSVMDVLNVIIVSCCFALVCIAIGLTINRFSKNSLSASASNTLVDLPMLMIGGCLWPKEVMPDYLQKLSDFMPTAWFMRAGETVISGGSLWDAKNELLYMLGFVIILLVISFTVKTEKVK